MIDLACVMFSTVFVLITVFRASQLDKKRPWFTDLVSQSSNIKNVTQKKLRKMTLIDPSVILK